MSKSTTPFSNLTISPNTDGLLSIEEPELWVYSSDGVGRYKNLAVFLKALPVEDSAAYEPHWILGYNQ